MTDLIFDETTGRYVNVNEWEEFEEALRIEEEKQQQIRHALEDDLPFPEYHVSVIKSEMKERLG